MLATRRLAKTVVRHAAPAASSLPKKSGGGMWAALADSESESDTAEEAAATSPPRKQAAVSVSVRTVTAAPAPVPVFVAPVAVKTVTVAVTSTIAPSDAEAAFRAMFASDPFILAMERGEMWGDLLYEKPAALPVVAAVEDEEERDPLAAIYSQPHAPLRATERDIWEQPFASALDEYWPDVYNTREMSDDDFHAMMSWLYSKGWYVAGCDRTGVHAYPDNAASLRWNPVTMEAEEPNRVRWADMEEPAKACCDRSACGGAGHSHAHRAAPAKKGPVTIPRFCRGGAACPDAGGSCRYVHGDTIPRLNEPCAFGAGCGASDPTGVKRSQCLRMHPGEEWSPELVIRRI